MTTAFADTSFFVALLNRRDDRHADATSWLGASSRRIVTSVWVLLELGNFVASTNGRREFSAFVSALRTNRRIRIVGASQRDFDRAVELYQLRSDKRWSLADCTSFVIMGRLAIQSALTTDHHFRQAGYQVIL